MKILITGGAGFIGANFIDHQLNAHPDDWLVCLDALTYAARPGTLDGAFARPNFRFVRGDIRDAAAVFALFEQERPDAVVNFAAESHVDRSIDDPTPFLQTNVLGAQVLMDACRAFGAARFHQVSTDEVYGDLPLGRPDLKFAEDAPPRPSSPYAASKASADLLTLAYHRTYGLDVVITRSSNNYGPFQCPEKLIPRMITGALAGEPLPVYGRGEQVRDWLHVADHCRAIDRVLRAGRPGEVYNVGGGCERENIQVVRDILRALGQSERSITFVADRPGHDLRYAVDSEKLRRMGWQPQIPFEQGLNDTVRWYLEHRDWWEEPGRPQIRA
ncbi:dTDP-glucose 4,6-dehydratase [Bacillota bacterium Meth-B3]